MCAGWCAESANLGRKGCWTVGLLASIRNKREEAKKHRKIPVENATNFIELLLAVQRENMAQLGVDREKFDEAFQMTMKHFNEFFGEDFPLDHV